MTLRITALFAVLLLASGCDSAAPDNGVSAYLGTYEGTRSVPNSRGETDTEGVVVTLVEGETNQAVMFQFQTEAGGGSTLPGTYDDETGLSVASEGLGFEYRFVAGLDGAISGTYTAYGVSGTVSGILTPSQFDLVYRQDNGAMTEIRTLRTRQGR